jgi:hypothetical protein
MNTNSVGAFVSFLLNLSRSSHTMYNLDLVYNSNFMTVAKGDAVSEPKQGTIMANRGCDSR